MSNVVDLTELDSDSDYALHSDVSDELHVVSVKQPIRQSVKKPKLDMLESPYRPDSDFESIIAPTSAFTKVSGNPNTLMTLVEGRGFASEIAYCLFNLETSHCSLSQFSDSASSMLIDPGAWRDLGLEDDDKQERSLFSAINHTGTKMGSRLLRANILQPSTDLSTIYARQAAVLEILDHEELFFFLSSRLVDIPDIDATITSLIRLTDASSSRQICQSINNVLHVKQILQMTMRITSDEIQVPIRAVYKPNTGYIMNAKLSDLGDAVPEEFVNVVIKKNVVSFTTLDLVKLNNRLSSVVVEINLLTEKAIHGVAETIRSNITVLYKVSEAIALLDMIVSFTSYCTLHSCVVPEFSDAINIVQGRHPVLEALGREVVPNDINTVTATFTVVSGPNMGGKSTYLRQIIYMAIMAQIGSL
ncbi:MutS protein msh4 [Coemansia brasiliensis]|uniref:MutS protein msh4 n=1 Tax=Coemansia brasiliensis TaxID=2650707 RepID=A0A9W8M1F7_9FUNG|nr:MutS protein msh4 [Coemansia brasiliensis]